MAVNRVDGPGGRVRGRGLVTWSGHQCQGRSSRGSDQLRRGRLPSRSTPLVHPLLGGGLTSWPEANQWVAEDLNSVLPRNKRPCRGLSNTAVKRTAHEWEFELPVDSAFPVTY